MNKEFKGFVLGVLTTLILTSGITFAYSQYKTIDVVENNVTIYANDNIVTTPNFTYNNTTYVPLRSVLELMDCSISYDEASKKVSAYNNFFRMDFPSVYNGYEYKNIFEGGYNENNEFVVTSIYTDATILRDITSVTTDVPDDEDVLYVYDLDNFSQYQDGSANNTNYNNTVTYIPSESLSGLISYSKFPWHLYSNDGKEYLGKLVTNKYDSDSIWYSYGDYGSKYSDTSIWYTYGDYGSKYSDTSAFNDYANKPPKIVNDDGELVGYLTTNKFISNGITIEELTQILKKYNQ